MDQVSKKLDRTAKDLQKIGSTLTRYVTVPIVAVGTATVKMAMDAIEAESLFSVSMGKMAGSARNWSEEMRRTLGVNAGSVRKMVGVFNVMVGSMGVGENAAYEMAKGLTQLSYDMASFYNISNEDAMSKLQSGISGEIMPLKSLGIVVNETTTKLYALNHGLIKQGQELSEPQKVLARYLTILEATKKAQGDLARTIESPANQFRMLKEKAQEVGVQIGNKLMPVALTLITTAKKGLMALQQLNPESQKMILIFAGLAAAAGPVILGIAGITKAIAFLIANPVTLGIAALGVLAASLIKVKMEMDNTGTASDNASLALKGLTDMVNTLGKAFDWVADKERDFFEWLVKVTGLAGPQTAEEFEAKYGTGKINKDILKKAFAGVKAEENYVEGTTPYKTYADMYADRAGYGSSQVTEYQTDIAGLTDEFKKLGETGDDAYSKLNDAVKNFTNNLKSQTDAFKNFVGIFDKAASDSPISMDRWLNRLKGQVRALSQYQANIKTLEARANAGIISQGLFQDLRALGPSAAKQLGVLAASNNAKLLEANKLYGQKGSIASNMAYGVVSDNMATEAKMIQIINNFNGGAKDEEVVSISKKIADQVIKQLKSQGVY
jgi:hypothetical protein